MQNHLQPNDKLKCAIILTAVSSTYNMFYVYLIFNSVYTCTVCEELVMPHINFTFYTWIMLNYLFLWAFIFLIGLVSIIIGCCTVNAGNIVVIIAKIAYNLIWVLLFFWAFWEIYGLIIFYGFYISLMDFGDAINAQFELFFNFGSIGGLIYCFITIRKAFWENMAIFWERGQLAQLDQFQRLFQ